MIKLILRLRFYLFILLMTIGYSSEAQTKWKTWGNAGVDLSLSKKTALGFNHLRSYNLSNSFSNNFNQTSATIDHDFTKHLTGKAGVTLSQYPSSGTTTQRYYLRGTNKVRLGGVVNWFNGLQAELHSGNETRFRDRIIYITRFAPRHRLDFLHLSPSVSYWLYYNLGGNPIQYYDKSGLPSVKQTPDGLHRGRLIINLNSKINKNLSVAIFYLNQTEFNLGNNKGLNVVNPSTGKITRPFDSYQVAGLTFTFNFNLYSKD